jgi:lactate dehydrogenase-like 2-hydroxyacid dehydrogenase
MPRSYLRKSQAMPSTTRIRCASRLPVLEPAHSGDSSDPPFFNSKAISLLPPGAIGVNTARGGLVIDDNLIAALKSGRVAAAGLDVLECEPKLRPEYIPLKNTLLLLHIGSATIETRTATGMLALDKVEAVLNGRPAPTLV